MSKKKESKYGFCLGTGPCSCKMEALLHPLRPRYSKELQLNVSTGTAKGLTLTPHYSMDTLTKDSK